MAKRVAVLLSGCGVLDGSEIHEAVLTLLALNNAGAEAVCCAPDADQADVIDHATNKPADEKRGVLAESARIARGKITELSKIKASDLDAIILPGGFGAAKNLCTYAAEGVNASVHPEVKRVLNEFAAAGKPIGAICIAPVVVAIALKGRRQPLALTIGTDETTAGHIKALGAEHVKCSVRDVVVDRASRVVTTPAYMLGPGPGDINVGIEKLVRNVIELAGE